MRTGHGRGDVARAEARYRAIYRRVHADHPACLADEWAGTPCADARGPVRPIVWSRRNGPWRRVEVLWVGAAPGNAGGLGTGDLGAHATRIPFGGDVAGANLDVLLGSIGLDRNETFITAALNQLPARGGGEPTGAEIRAPVGSFPSSVHLLRATLLAAGPALIVALGNVGLRVIGAAVAPGEDVLRIPTLARIIGSTAFARNETRPLALLQPPDAGFLADWRAAWDDDPLPHVLWLTHPSGQNMSPFAREETLFHQRMLEARAALRDAAVVILGREPPPARRPPSAHGIYNLPEWRERVAPRHARLDALWRDRGV
jgi:uracil-DNA glycosylase